MKKPEEIKNGLGHCATYGFCSECPYRHHGWSSKDCKRMLVSEALKYIQQLEAEAAKQAQRIAELEQELAAVKQERDAAVDGLKKAAASGSVCIGCTHMGSEETSEMCQQNDFNCLNCHPGCVCKACRNNSLWQWRCVRPQNTEVQDGK